MQFRLLLLLLFTGFLQLPALPAGSDPGTVFFVGPENQNQHLVSLLKFSPERRKTSSRTNTEKQYLIPDSSELQNCKMLVISPMTAVTPQARAALTGFVEQGGILVWLYDSIWRTWQAGGGLGFELPGFDGWVASHHEPYDQKTLKSHRLGFASVKWGTQTLPPYATVYCLFATDLIDAEAIIVDLDHPERALLCVSSRGLGKVFFCGAGSQFFPLIVLFSGIQ